MTKRLMKYNPAFLTEEELLTSFVVRHADFELIMQVIRENTGPSNQHILVIGPRGIGKTTLVHRVAAEVKRTEGLRENWHPLIFSEESYEVVSAGEFWLEALFHLSEQTDDEKWTRTYVELKSESDDQRLGERALAQLLDFADSQGKRILLMVENLNMLFSDLTSEEEAWKIRHTLINEPRLMLLATATNRFENIENSSHAMFEMFKMQELKPLDDEECNSIWELITGQRLMGERIRPVRILTGGNPRLLTIIAKFSAHRSFRKLLDDLVDLIDDHTEYFKSHLDNLPAIERKVYLALAGLWDASTARDIAKAARLDVNKTSSLLNRLVGRGAVVVEEQGKKTKWYVVAERMYNIYYLMRRRGKPADRVKATVKFMVSMYDPESAVRLITDEACGLSPEVCTDYYLAYEVAIKEVSDRELLNKIITSTPKIFLESPYISETLKNFTTVEKDTQTKEQYNEMEITELDETVEINKQGVTLLDNGNFEQAIEKFDGLISKFDSVNKELFKQAVSIALASKGIALHYLGRFEESIKVSEEVVGHFNKGSKISVTVAMALVFKGVALGKLGRYGEAMEAYEEIIDLIGDSKEIGLTELSAMALFNKGVSLGILGRIEEAIAVYDEVAALFADWSEPGIAKLVALSLLNKGAILRELNRSNEELQAYEELVALYKDRTEPQIAERVASAFIRKGIALNILGRSEEAITVFDMLTEHFGGREEKELAVEVAKAFVFKGLTLGQLGRFESVEVARKYVQNAFWVEKTVEYAIDLFVEIAASGFAKEALGILVNSPAVKHLEPLIVGLKLYIGEDVKTAVEILEVAKDVVKRIEERKQQKS